MFSLAMVGPFVTPHIITTHEFFTMKLVNSIFARHFERIYSIGPTPNITMSRLTITRVAIAMTAIFDLNHTKAIFHVGKLALQSPCLIAYKLIQVGSCCLELAQRRRVRASGC